MSTCIVKKAMSADLAHVGIVTCRSDDQAYFQEPVTIYKLQPNMHEPGVATAHSRA